MEVFSGIQFLLPRFVVFIHNYTVCIYTGTTNVGRGGYFFPLCSDKNRKSAFGLTFFSNPHPNGPLCVFFRAKIKTQIIMGEKKLMIFSFRFVINREPMTEEDGTFPN